MADFDPTAYLAKAETAKAAAPAGFDPTAYLAKIDAAKTAPAQKNYSLGEVPIEMARNAPANAVEAAKGIFQAVTQPIDTATTLVQAAGGGAYSALPKPVQDYWRQVSTNPAQLDKNIEVANALGGIYKERYGSWDAIKRTFAEHPIDALMDLSTVLSGGSSATGAVGKTGNALRRLNAAVVPGGLPAAPGLNALATGLETVGKLEAPLQTASQFTNPLTPVGLVTQPLAQRSQANARAAQSQNAVRDATLKAAQDEGYLVTPGSANPTLGNVSLERLGGKSRLEQNMSVNNQQVTNKLARRDLGLPETQAIDENLLKQIRKDEYAKGYEPVKQVGQINTDRTLVNDLNQIKTDFSGTASFPKATVDKVEQEVNRFQKLNFTAADAVDEARALRSQATRNMASAEADTQALGLAQRKIADALENQIERQLAANPATAGLIDQYKASRRLMAKTHVVEEALVKGSGDISTAKLAQLRQSGEMMDAGLKTAADFGNVFKHVNRPPSSIGTPGGAGLFYGTAGGLGGSAAFFATGGDYLTSAAAAAAAAGTAAAARGGARAVLQSPFGQARAIPSYDRRVRNALANQPVPPAVNALYYGGQAAPFAER